ncbi:Tetraspanin family [Favolaschia claudopus]|uniref:Tetraspanin family n=1 Tax=Favolaschia claudopus TaxID=2862362 RepID=A0AAW0CGL3_9AGAR
MALFQCRKFLGCIPLQIAVWLLALLAILVSGAGAAGGWLEVSILVNHPLPLWDRIAIIVQSGTLSLLFLLSFLGFFAGLSGKRGVVYIYSKFVFIHSPLLLVSLGLALFFTLKPDTDSDAVKKCMNGTKNSLIVQFCDNGFSVINILPIALLGAAILIQFSAWIVATSYGEERDRETKFADSDLEASRSMLEYPEHPFATRR